MGNHISSDAAGRRENARRANGRFGAQHHAEADVSLSGQRPHHSLTQLTALWEEALDADGVNQDLMESLDIPMVRDSVAAIASSDAPGNHARVLSGAEAMGQVPRGSGALSGRMTNPADAEWAQGIFVGEGVVPGERLRRLEAATEGRTDLSSAAASGAACLNGWARWQLGDTAGARGTLVSELDQNPDNQLAGLLMQVMDVQRRRG